MSLTFERIPADLAQLLEEIADDWEYGDPITPEVMFLADLGLDSLDIVILSTITQEFYDQEMPFTELFEAAGKKAIPDLSIGEWIEFIDHHRQLASAVRSAAE